MEEKIDLTKLGTHELIEWLKMMEPSIERELVLLRWKHKNVPNAGLFSTAHGGDCSGNLLRALAGQLDWPETTKINGKTITLEYEANFNTFVRTLRRVLYQ